MGKVQDLVSSKIYGTRRLKTDNGSTSHAEGRLFRFFWEMTIPSGQSRWVKFTVPNGVIAGIDLSYQSLSVSAGGIRYRSWVDATVNGLTLAAPASPLSGVVKTNRLNNGLKPDHELASDIQLSSNTQTGSPSGQVGEIKRVITAGATAQQISITGESTTVRSIPPGTYYLQFEALGNNQAVGVYELEFAEIFM